MLKFRDHVGYHSGFPNEATKALGDEATSHTRHGSPLKQFRPLLFPVVTTCLRLVLLFIPGSDLIPDLEAPSEP